MSPLTIIYVIAAGLIGVNFMNGATAQNAAPDPLQLERKISLDGVTGRIDHMAVDIAPEAVHRGTWKQHGWRNRS